MLANEDPLPLFPLSVFAIYLFFDHTSDLLSVELGSTPSQSYITYIHFSSCQSDLQFLLIVPRQWESVFLLNLGGHLPVCEEPAAAAAAR